MRLSLWRHRILKIGVRISQPYEQELTYGAGRQFLYRAIDRSRLMGDPFYFRILLRLFQKDTCFVFFLDTLDSIRCRSRRLHNDTQL